MVCRVVNMWSLSGLVGGFVDLAIAYFLLCASAVVYIASKFLGFLGFYLPCPCTFLPTNNYYCLRRLFIHSPIQKLSNVQLSLRNNFPFNSYGYVDIIDCHGQCTSYISDSSKPNNLGMLSFKSPTILDDVVVGERGFDVKGKDKGKGLINQSPPPGWFLRRRGVPYSLTNSSVASCDPPSGDVIADYSSLSDNAIDSHHPYWKRDIIVSDEFPDENDEEETLSTSVVEKAEPSQYFASGFGDENDVKLLKQALKDEQAARTTLYLELEKERSASASAADEAMAMILRLQEEKAMVEMEARQYQRIIEEKFAYDAEERNILKDILLIQEREKHSLEKEVEEYRQMINLGNEQIQEDAENFEKKNVDSLVDPCEDPVSIIDMTIAPVDEKVSLKDMRTSPCSSNGEPNVQEKEMIPFGLNLYAPPQNDQRQEEAAIYGETSSSQQDNFSDRRIQHYLEQQKLGSFNQVSVAMSDKEPQVHDIHVIVDEPGLPDEHERSQDNFLLVNDISKTISKIDLQPVTSSGQSIGVTRNCGSTSIVGGGTEIQRSTSPILGGLPPLGPQKRSMSSGQLRNLMSPMDSERFKIDHEICYLRDRLRIIQEGREKLNLSNVHQERENVRLKLLEDISGQLQAIRLLTEHGKPGRQASLPPQFPKVTLKKRRSRSASSGIHKSC